MAATTNPDKIRSAATSHGWQVHGRDELVITRHQPTADRIDVHFGARGQVIYCAFNGRQYSSQRRMIAVLEWLTNGGPQ